MTREEAIQVLSMVEAHGTLVIQAKEMAIKALKQEPCDKCVYSTSEGCQYDDITETIPPFETSDDAISRQAVLDITWEEPSYTDAMNVLTEVRDKVKELPSVNPLPKALTKEERELVQRWRDNRGISMEEFAKALELLEGSEEE